MTEILETLAMLSVLVFVIGSMASMGLSLKMPQIMAPLKNGKLVIFALVANFILVPIVAMLITAIIHHRLDEYAIGEAEAQAQHFLLAYKSVRSLVREWHKPEIYRLQENNELSQDYFSPALLSTTFNARGFVGFLNQNLQGTESRRG